MKKYAIVLFDGFKLPGQLNESETKLFHLKKKGLYLSLGNDTQIIARFDTKKEFKNY